ncbi:MAG: NifU family protein [Planctomycetota bacterium]
MAKTADPAPTTAEPEDLRAVVLRALDRIRPAIQDDGGDLELVGVSRSGHVQVRLLGACVGCPSSSLTLREGIERCLKEWAPGVQSVEAVA